MSLLPVPINESTSLTPRQIARAQRLQARADLTVFRHGLEARARAEIDTLDSQAVADASRAALEEECDLFDYGLSRAGGSAIKAELVARHVQRLAKINDRRITRRFSG